jgi:hypothetical protein
MFNKIQNGTLHYVWICEQTYTEMYITNQLCGSSILWPNVCKFLIFHLEIS